MTKQTPSYVASAESKKFIVESGSEDDKQRFMMRIFKAEVIVTTMFGDKVSFSKTNRSKSWRDSREKPNKQISKHEVISELRRLLDNETLAEKAFQEINV